MRLSKKGIVASHTITYMPFEAMYNGASIVVANTSCLPEIYQGSAHYIDAYDTDCDLDDLIKQPVNDAQQVLSRYGWDISARKLKDLLYNLMQRN